MTLTHWFQLRDELLFCPLLLLPPQRHRVGDQHLVVVRVGHVQVVHKDNIRILHQNLIKSKLFSRLNLKEPIASTVEGWKDGGVDIAAVDALQWEKRGQCLWSVRMKRSCDAGVFIFHTRRGSLDIFAPGASGERGSVPAGWSRRLIEKLPRLASPQWPGYKKCLEGGEGGG